jgi:general secretion pathway protein J
LSANRLHVAFSIIVIHWQERLKRKGFNETALNAKSFLKSETQPYMESNPMRKLPRQHGFTLIEILMALMIFAIIATLVSGALRTIIQAHTRNDLVAQQLQDLQMVLTLMQSDIQQMTDRPILDSSGHILPSFIANTASNTNSLEFTRSGFLNPLAAERRSTLQRVAYHLDGSNLVRETWEVLDRANTTQSAKNTLLTGVKSLKFRFVGIQNQFYDNWPTPTPPSPPLTPAIPPLILPRGVEAIVTLDKWGTLSRVFTVGGVGFVAQTQQ